MVALVTAVLVAACEAPPAPMTTSDAGVAVATLPAAPVLGPCPRGWREVTEESGLVSCDPWPTSGRADCVLDELHVPGGAGCEPAGSACPPDGWPAALPTDRPIVYVDDDAAPGGDGSSRGSALTTLGDATLVAPAGAVIAVAGGSYDGAITLRDGQSLVGACAARTVLTASAPSSGSGVLTSGASGVSIRDVSIVDAARPGIVVTGGDTTLDGVVVRGAQLVGLYVASGTLTGHGVVVASVRAIASGGGRGVQVQDGAQVTLSHVAVTMAQEAGIAVVGAGTRLDASDLAVVSIEPGTTGEGGIGVLVDDHATLVLARAAIEQATKDGLFVLGGASADLEDARIAETRLDPAGELGDGMHVEDATLTVRRVVVTHSHALGVFAAGPLATLDATGLVVRDTVPLPDGTEGRGIEVGSGAGATLRGVRLERNAEISLFVSGAGTHATAEDLAVTGTRPSATDGAGRGIGVEDAAALSVTRASVEGSYSTAVFASVAGTSLDVQHLTVRDTRAPADGSSGRGIAAQSGAHVVVAHALVEDSTEVGLLSLHAGTRLEISDCVVRRTRPDGAGRLGIGAWTEQGGELVLTRTRIEASRLMGAGAFGDSRLTAQELVIDGVEPSACTPACADMSGGFGIVAYAGGQVSVSGFEISNVALCGALVSDAFATGNVPGLDLAHGVVRHADVGACVQVPGYDVERLHVDVAYEDVGVPLQATSYPVPDPPG